MIKLLCDTSSDFTLEEAKELGIELIPMTINFGEEVYKDVFELTNEQFFQKLTEGKEFPHSSQVPPFAFEEKFEELTKDGSEVICITMSSKLSGTFQSGCLAAMNYPGVRMVDSTQVTCGQKVLCLYALDLIKQGKELDEIVDELNYITYDIAQVALLDTFEYLAKGGRIPSVVAHIGNALNLKPSIEIKNGVVGFLGVARGTKHGNNKVREKIEYYGGVDFNYPVVISYSGLSDSIINRFIKETDWLQIDREKLHLTLIGSTIGTHIGPDAISVAFVRGRRRKRKDVRKSEKKAKTKESKKSKEKKAKEEKPSKPKKDKKKKK